MKPDTTTSTQEAPSLTLPENHQNATNALLVSLGELETLFAPLFITPSTLSETLAKLGTEKRCQLELLIAYAMNTLAYSMFLRLPRPTYLPRGVPFV